MYSTSWAAHAARSASSIVAQTFVPNTGSFRATPIPPSFALAVGFTWQRT